MRGTHQRGSEDCDFKAIPALQATEAQGIPGASSPILAEKVPYRCKQRWDVLPHNIDEDLGGNAVIGVDQDVPGLSWLSMESRDVPRKTPHRACGQPRQ